MSTASTVSIGLPVYNGQSYLRSALDSLLVQDYTEFELIISDNASTDDTAQICREYAQADNRVRFFANRTNVGAARNFNAVFSHSRGKYFMWAAHDDMWAPSYISKCVAALDDDKDLVLCTSNINFIDDRGEPVNSVEYHGGPYNRLDTSNMDLRQRVRTLTERRGWYAFYGLMRADLLRHTGLCSDSFGCDVVLLLKLLLLGPTAVLPDYLFFYRLIRKSHETYFKDITATEPAAAIAATPYTDLARGLIRVIDDCRTLSPCVRAELKNDLLDNVCQNNKAWLGDLVAENSEVMREQPYLRGIALRKVLIGDIAPADVARLREQAYERWVSSMPLGRRLGSKLVRFLDRYILWRLKSPQD